MPLNKSKGNMYEWISRTFNPIGGECPHKCPYCYVKYSRAKKKYIGPPYLVEHELRRSLGKGHFYFVCSMFDIFAWQNPGDWILKILKHLSKYPDNEYLLQSKNPERANFFLDYLPKKYILGTTIETNRYYPKEMGYCAPIPLSRARYLATFGKARKMVTIEPIMDFDTHDLVKMVRMCNPEWVNIGADSKNNGLPEPNPKKISALIYYLKEDGIEVKLKSNLKRLL